jgi:hypothetical protein
LQGERISKTAFAIAKAGVERPIVEKAQKALALLPIINDLPYELA